MRRLQIRPQAVREAREAFRWYEQERTTLGAEFMAAIQELLEAARRLPDASPAVGAHTRRALLRRFPYLVLYVVEADVVVVTAIMHTHRDPRRWSDRVHEHSQVLGGFPPPGAHVAG